MMTHRTMWAALVAVGGIGLTAPAHAAFTQLTDPTQILTQNIFAVPDGGAGMSVTSPIIVSAGGNTATFSTVNNGKIFLQDSTGMGTAFSDGTPLLETFNSTFPGKPDGPLSISFGQGVQAFGLFGQTFDAGTAESFTVNAFDGATAFTPFTVGPVDNSQGSGAALFLGGLATGGDTITKVTISSTSNVLGSGDDALYGPLSVGTAVPEPSPLTLVGLGLLGLPLLARRARRA